MTTLVNTEVGQASKRRLKRARKAAMKTSKKTRSITAHVGHSCYEACNRAGLLRFGRPVRPGQRFRDERKEGARTACRGKGGTRGD